MHRPTINAMPADSPPASAAAGDGRLPNERAEAAAADTGVTPAVLPPPHIDKSLIVPFRYPVSAAERHGPLSAALVHLFYHDLASEIFGYLCNIPGRLDIFVTTDTDAKRQAIRSVFAGWERGIVDIRLVPNRGRDIAAKLVGLHDVHHRYERVLHVHGKKTVPWPHGEGWRRYLYRTLLGSTDIIASVFEAFDRDPRLGIVFPQHWDLVRPALSWGYSYSRASNLARRMNIEIALDHLLEFPSGSMFWARSAALMPFLKLGLSFEDFPEEGFERGSLADTIERLYLHACEHSGHTWLKIADPHLLKNHTGLMDVRSPVELDERLQTMPYSLGDPALRKNAAVSRPPSDSGPSPI
jgi:lipopolysaccharide biosynthesis protein